MLSLQFGIQLAWLFIAVVFQDSPSQDFSPYASGTEGVPVQIGGGYEGLYALGIMALGQFCGDSLATNENFGMVHNFITVL